MEKDIAIDVTDNSIRTEKVLLARDRELDTGHSSRWKLKTIGPDELDTNLVDLCILFHRLHAVVGGQLVYGLCRRDYAQSVQ